MAIYGWTPLDRCFECAKAADLPLGLGASGQKWLI